MARTPVDLWGALTEAIEKRSDLDVEIQLPYDPAADVDWGSKHAAVGPLSAKPPPTWQIIGRNSECAWYHYISYFFGGALLVNAIPHFVSSVAGHPFRALSRRRPAVCRRR